MELRFLGEVFGNKVSGFGNEASVTVTFTEFSLMAVWPLTYIFWPFQRWLLICFWRSLPRGMALRRSTCGNDQCPVAPEDAVQPGLCLAKGQEQGQSWGMDGQDPVDSLWVFAVPSLFPPVPTQHTLGGGPSVDGERPGGISGKLSGEPCISTALYKVQ